MESTLVSGESRPIDNRGGHPCPEEIRGGTLAQRERWETLLPTGSNHPVMGIERVLEELLLEV